MVTVIKGNVSPTSIPTSTNKRDTMTPTRPRVGDEESRLPLATRMRTLTVATVNVRYDGQADHPVPIPRYGAVPPAQRAPWSGKFVEKPWAERRSRLVDCLLSIGHTDIIGFQEVLHNQLLDLSTLLGDTYAHVGVGRDDGKQAGEHSPIFFDRTKFEIVDWGTIWLSPTPDVPGSKGWDAALTRIATLLTLRRNADPTSLIHVVNTHYDHRGVRARAESSLLIRSQIWRWVKRVEKEHLGLGGSQSSTSGPDPGPVILFGDFNSPPEEEGYGNITSPHALPSGQPSYTFLDTYKHLQARSSSSFASSASSSSASSSPPFAPISNLTQTQSAARPPRLRQSAPYGPELTYTGFTPPGVANRESTRIDFIMLGKEVEEVDPDPVRLSTASAVGGENDSRVHGKERKGIEGTGWTVTQYACVDNWVEGDADGWQGRWSDHRAVRVTLARED